MTATSTDARGAATPQPDRLVRSDLAPNATLVERIDLTPAISRFVVRPDDGVARFEPGQYLALGLMVEGRLLQRPYSTATLPGTGSELEFLIRLVPGGAFTERLWPIRVGARLRLGGPKGLFTLRRADPRTHLFLATGTGIAPFVSMTSVLMAAGVGHRDLRDAARPRLVVAHGVSVAGDLAYRDRLEAYAARGPSFRYVPLVSRPSGPNDVPSGGLHGRLETRLDELCDTHAIDPATTVAYLCGNPGMIAAASLILATRGFPADSIISEQYWPGACPITFRQSLRPSVLR